MKKLLPIIVFVLIVVGALYLASSGSDKAPTQSAKETQSASTPDDSDSLDDTEIDQNVDERPAAELYSSSELAFAAVEKGAVDYDDLVLEQFVTPGPECTWCDTFYASVKEKILAEGVDDDERSYFAEILAISGRPENIRTLVEAIKIESNPDIQDLYAEALELSIGGDDLVEYIGTELGTKDELLHESLLVALTNQGSLSSAQMLYDETFKMGDADGGYSLGYGLGEFIPDPDDAQVMTFLQSKLKQNDKFSHLMVKALLNSGIDGLRIVVDELKAIKDNNRLKDLLKDSADHVPYDESVEQFISQIAKDPNSPAPLIEWAKSVEEDFKLSSEFDDEDPGDLD